MLDKTRRSTSGDHFPGERYRRISVLWLILTVGPGAVAGGFSQAVSPVRPAKSFKEHTVRPGDTLYSLARNNGTTVPAVMAANRLRSNRIRVGQVLRLPSDAPDGGSADDAGSVEAVGDRDGSTAASPSEGLPSDGLPEDAEPPPTLRARLVEAATRFLGVRYRRSGTSEKTGFDCSGLVQNVFRKLGIELPRSSREQYRSGIGVLKQELAPGDLVFFSPRKTPNHVAIYIGENRILHALSGARKVVVTPLDKPYFKRHFLGARRIPALWEDSVQIADSSGHQ